MLVFLVILLLFCTLPSLARAASCCDDVPERTCSDGETPCSYTNMGAESETPPEIIDEWNNPCMNSLNQLCYHGFFPAYIHRKHLKVFCDFSYTWCVFCCEEDCTATNVVTACEEVIATGTCPLGCSERGSTGPMFLPDTYFTCECPE